MMVKREAKNKKKEGTKSKKHVGHVRERKPIPKKKKAKDAFPDFTKKPKRRQGVWEEGSGAFTHF